MEIPHRSQQRYNANSSPFQKLGAMLTTVQCTHHVEQESGLLPSKHCHDETKPRQARADENRGESAS